MAKPSKTAKTERQRLIDETLKKQKSAEKRRGNVIIAGAIVIALAIIGVAAGPVVWGNFKESAYADTPVDEIGAAASVCQKPIEKEGKDVGTHVEQPEEVTYDTAPPAFGAHWNVAGVAPASFKEKFYDADDRPALEALVHNLEHGYTIMWYDETIADDVDELAQVKAIARKFKESGDNMNFRNKFIAAPWTSDDEDGAKFPQGQHVAFTHWKGDTTTSTGVWQYCSDVSGDALVSFLDTYPYTDAPEATIQ
ncbi:DUF3105 domain-containing protein [Nocardioides sp.]|uniref:DUF3105 domain-containing protein n=1 Tax=Nocardioides sp. TaxID=35761 RepID=UPI0027213D78|nr:DUF3105 domain-containing protein [Nocardioides sp.]MDO9456871.1 DUF3105 domain-containing protein [Nocardioides sp.]